MYFFSAFWRARHWGEGGENCEGDDDAAWGAPAELGHCPHEDAAGVEKGQFWGVAAIPFLLSPLQEPTLKNLGQTQCPGPQAESSSIFLER